MWAEHSSVASGRYACSHCRDRALHAEEGVPTCQRCLPPTFHWKCSLAHWCDYGWVRNLHLRAAKTLLTHCSSIHERSAREKISRDQVAHVLNDEVSRKYIQSLKRYEPLNLSFHYPLIMIIQTTYLLTNEISPRGYFSANGLKRLYFARLV